MNPLVVLGWLAVAIVSLILLATVILVTIVVVGFVQFLLEERRKKLATREAMEKGILAFDKFNTGDYLTIAGRKWKVREIEQSFDIDYNQDKVFLYLVSDRDDLLYGP